MAHRHMKAAVVDSDKDSLLSLKKVLEECNYIVTQCENSEQFLSTIQEDQTKFQLVIIEVSVTPIDGYELCRLVREYTHIPIIVTSSSSTCSSAEIVEMVKKALHQGSSDFLLNPIKVEDLMKINLNATHKRFLKQEWSHGDEEPYITNRVSLEKHREELVMTTLEQPASKKRRYVLPDVFVKGVNKLGPESKFTRETMPSHLQKCRQRFWKQQQQRQQQQFEQNIVKLKQVISQTIMSVPSSSISHKRETDDPIINSEQQVQATNPNPTLLMHDPNPSSSAHVKNTNPAHYMDEVVHLESSNMGLAMDFPTRHEPAGLPSAIISGIPITPRIEHMLNGLCHDQYLQPPPNMLNGLCHDFEHNLRLINPAANGGDGQGHGDVANENDRINPHV